MKTCNKCHRSRDISFFYHDRHKKDGLHGSCKACENTRKKMSRDRRRLVRMQSHAWQFVLEYASRHGWIE